MAFQPFDKLGYQQTINLRQWFATTALGLQVLTEKFEFKFINIFIM